MRRVTLWGVALLARLVTAASAAAPAHAQDDEDSSQIRFDARQAMLRATCGPGDRPEPGMQGRVPPTDAFAVRAQEGYSCNLTVVGHLPATGFAGLDGLGDCAYYSLGPAVGGVLVVDVSDPANPVPTATLLTPAMQDTGESMRVNAKRKLLVAGSYATNGYLDIYDITDCRHPRLLSSTDMSPGLGHEGWFAPDGMTYYMSASRANADSVFPIDVSDPARPKRLANWMIRPGTASHGGFTSEDGKVTYICHRRRRPWTRCESSTPRR